MTFRFLLCQSIIETIIIIAITITVALTTDRVVAIATTPDLGKCLWLCALSLSMSILNSMAD